MTSGHQSHLEKLKAYLEEEPEADTLTNLPPTLSSIFFYPLGCWSTDDDYSNGFTRSIMRLPGLREFGSLPLYKVGIIPYGSPIETLYLEYIADEYLLGDTEAFLQQYVPQLKRLKRLRHIILEIDHFSPDAAERNEIRAAVHKAWGMRWEQLTINYPDE